MSQDSETNSNSTASSYTPTFIFTYESLIKIVSHIEFSSDVLRTARAVRLTNRLRKNLTEDTLIQYLLNLVLSKNSELNARLSSFLIIEEDEEADSAMSVCTKEFSLELEFYCYFLVLIFLIDQKRYYEAKVCSLNGIARAMSLNMAELDFVSVLAARLYFYYSYSYEASGDLAEIRRNLLEWYSVAALNHDELGQARILTRSNKQTLRYLFYTGKIQTIRLAYTSAKESFQQAVLRAPVAARGFRIQCSKWAVLARLLLGEIPEKTIFMQTGMKRALRPYFELTNALRIGDMELFCNVTEMFSGTFISDRTKNVIVRLQHSVIRTGLCNISISYSRISLAEVADRLKLHSRNLLPDVENIVAKAIHDGAINAKIDHANGWLISKETRDIYATAEPQAAFSSRIAFYLNLYNETVRASHFPSDNDTHEKRRSASQVLYGEVLELLEEGQRACSKSQSTITNSNRSRASSLQLRSKISAAMSQDLRDKQQLRFEDSYSLIGIESLIVIVSYIAHSPDVFRTARSVESFEEESDRRNFDSRISKFCSFEDFLAA